MKMKDNRPIGLLDFYINCDVLHPVVQLIFFLLKDNDKYSLTVWQKFVPDFISRLIEVFQHQWN